MKLGVKDKWAGLLSSVLVLGAGESGLLEITSEWGYEYLCINTYDNKPIVEGGTPGTRKKRGASSGTQQPSFDIQQELAMAHELAKDLVQEGREKRAAGKGNGLKMLDESFYGEPRKLPHHHHPPKLKPPLLGVTRQNSPSHYHPVSFQMGA
jgi:hypothetical protein